jgi:radical SAM protein with 4Fe4S-binding SPASM domain
MAEATAERILDFALQSTATDLTVEFYSTNGEALSHFDLMRSLMDASRVLSRQAAGKRIRFRLQTDFSKMSEAAAEWIVSNQVEVCFKFHGPAALHDSIRGTVGGGEHAKILYWTELFARAPALPSGVSSVSLLDARLTTTRQVLVDWRQVIDEYVARGLRTICFQMLPRAAVSGEEWERIGYAVPEFEAVYRQALAYLLELNGRGIDIREGTACLILPKVFGVDDAAAVQIQSPCASGTGELAYSPEGRIFPSAEAQLLAWRGDPMFDLGDVREVTISDVARHPTVRAIAAASLLDAQPLCSDCWNKPFCGYSPVRNYIEQGDLHGQRHRCTECREHMLISKALFEILGRGAEYESALKAWLI